MKTKVMSIGIFSRLKQSRGYGYYKDAQNYRERKAQERFEKRPQQIERMKRETQFLEAKSRFNRARQSNPSPFRSFITGPPTMNMGFGFQPSHRTRRGKHKRGGHGKTIIIRT
jgi:hypothetical protein